MARDAERPEVHVVVGDERGPRAHEGIGADKRDILWRVHEVNQAAIRFADTKAGTAAGLALAATGAAFSPLLQARRPDPTDPLGWVLSLAVSGLCAGILFTVAATLMTILPRRGDRRAGPRGMFPGWPGAADESGPLTAANPLYFRAAASRSEDAYCRALARADIERLGEALARDVWRVARICERKYAWVGRTLWATAVTSLCALAVLLALWGLADRKGTAPRVPTIAARPAR